MEPKPYLCLHCGTDYDELPVEGVCKACDEPKVVNLRDASEAEIAGVLQRRGSVGRKLRREVVVGAVVLLIPLVLIAVIGLREDEPVDCSRRVCIYPNEDPNDPHWHAVSERLAEQLRAMAGSLRVCYPGGTEPGTAEVMSLRWQQTSEGVPSGLEAFRSSVSTAVQKCVIDLASSWVLPVDSPAGFMVELPLSFFARNGAADVSFPAERAVIP